MAKQYKKRNSPGRSGNMLGQLFLVMVVFVAGYMSASLYNLASVTAWINTHVLAKNSAKLIVKPGLQQAQLPKPKFEFYTLLAEGAPVPKSSMPVATAAETPSTPTVIQQRVSSASSALIAQNESIAQKMPVAEHVPVAQHMPAPQNLSVAHSVSVESGVSHDMYLLQLASFPRQADAQKMRKSLMMKGFNVSVTQVTQQGNRWYRVVVGPFASKTDAERVQGSLARSERMFGMIRKMNI